MPRALRTLLTTALTLIALGWPAPAPAGSGSGLFISSYWLVSWRPVAPSVAEFTFRATLTNLGAPIPGATATATPASPAVAVVDGTLTFGPVGRYRTVVSTDTFTIQYDCTEPLKWPFLRWTITSGGANQPPVADAGADSTRRVGEVAHLDGSASSDPDGNPLTYLWTLTELPAGSSAALSDPTAVQPTFLVDRPGRYTAQLVVNDGSADSPPDTVTVTTENTPPVANAGPDQTSPVGRTVTLDGSGSSDIDGDALTLAWTIVSVPAGSAAVLSDPTAVNPGFVVDLPGEYTIELTVNDGITSSLPDRVVVSTVNSAPVADAGPDQTTTVTATVTLDGSGSSDVDGDALTFAWSFVTRPAGSLATLSDPAAVGPTFPADQPGTYSLQLIVNDGVADSAPDSVTITTQNSPPVAHAGADQTVFVGDTVTLDGSGSSDVDGQALIYAWSLTSVPPGSAATLSDPTAVMPTFAVDVPGTYVAQLIVNDGQAPSVPDTVTVSTLNSPPVANAGPDQAAIAGQVVLLDGTASKDPDGDPLTYRWSIASRPQGSTAALTAETTAGPSLVVDMAGTYIVQLIVNDGSADSAPDTMAITTSNAVPVANAGPDQTDAPVGTLVTLDGSGSQDADGHPLTFEWVLLTRPAGSSASLGGATTPFPTFTPDAGGDYVAQLIVNDGFVDSAPDTVLIRAVDPEPVIVTVEATDASASESGDDGLFTVSRTGDVTSALTVTYQVIGTAINGVDFDALATSVTIPAGAVAATIAVSPIDDDLIEQAERVEVRLASGVGYTVGSPALAIVTIADNDLPVVTVSATDATASEAGPTTGTLTFSRTGSTDAALLVSFSRGGTAVSINTGPQDYGGIGQAVTIPAGASEATVTIVPLADNLVEGAESVELTIEPAPAYVVGSPAAAAVTIADDPAVARIEASDPAASEAGPDPGVFTLSRSGGDTTAALAVTVAIGGTATNNGDYGLLSGLVTIPGGELSVAIAVNPIADNRVEGAETVVLTIQPGSGIGSYVVGSPSAATVTIADDPAVVTVVATDPDASETGANPGVFTFTRSGGNVSASLTLFVTRGGTAANGIDYPSLGGGTFLVTIPAGETSATVTIAPIADGLAEPAETVILTIAPSAAYTIGASSSATVTITDGIP